IESRYLRTPRSGQPAPVHMRIEFTNLSGTPIQTQFSFQDAMPERRRFEPGNHIQLVLLPDATPGNRIMLAGSRASIHPPVFFGLIAIFSAILTGLVLLGAHIWRHTGSLEVILNRFAEATGLFSMSAILMGVLIFLWLVFKFVSVQMNRAKDESLRFYGRSATARITNVNRTGTKIGTHYVVEFTFQFQDAGGREHTGSDTMLFDPIDLGNARNITEKEVLYLPDNPAHAAFADNVNQPSPVARTNSRILNFVYYVVALVFTIVILWNAYAALVPGD
ncbi:MAG: hypothetical protein KDK27_17570, partial [Leptospiraceae bacterium]|nr:hypothetical protein [Leptospiraceae bacterium]